MEKNIPLSVPNLKGNEKKYVLEAIEDEWVSTGGKYIDKFEENIAKYLNTIGAIACQSGTAGLHLALILSGIEAGDEVIVPTLTFIAAVNPVKYLLGEVVFMDCNESLTMDENKLEEYCEKECLFINGKLINKKTKKHLKSIVVVHVFGNIANMEKIMEIGSKYNLKVIEDATEALGSKFIDGKYRNMYAGTIGDFGVYSFNGNKIITTGGGGMIVAKEAKDLIRLKLLSTQAKLDSLNYTHNEIGYNYRMTNVQAAIGVAQLEKLEEFIDIKEDNYKIYKEKIDKIRGLELIVFKKDIRPNYWFYSVLIKDEYPLEKAELIELLSKRGIQARPIWDLIQKQKPYQNSQVYKVNKAFYYLDRIINIPCSSNLTEAEIERVIKVLKEGEKISYGNFSNYSG